MGRRQQMVSKTRLDLGDAVWFAVLTLVLQIAERYAFAIAGSLAGNWFVSVIGLLTTCLLVCLGFLAGRRGSTGGLLGVIIGILGYWIVLVGASALLSRIA